MDRLTEKAWRNLDPWECCGQDNYCKRGCHEIGGCTNGCVVPRNYVRLARYEDTDLNPDEITALQEKSAHMERELKTIKRLFPALEAAEKMMAMGLPASRVRNFLRRAGEGKRMKKYICEKCGRFCFSAASLEDMRDHKCPYPGCPGNVKPATEEAKQGPTSSRIPESE